MNRPATGEKDPFAVTPLHIAYELKNFRSVKVLLTYMAKIDFNASNTFKDILPELVTYRGFTHYMDKMLFQTE